MPLETLLDIPPQALRRDFLIEYGHVEVTSIDIASHGGFCIAACSNGAVVLFDLTRSASQTNGYLIAHIQPKGMHTTLRFTVKITEDSRFCFAGVRKGSSDLVAVDLARFNLSWNDVPVQLSKPPRGKKSTVSSNTSSDDFLLPAFDVYTCNDAKLRGFGAVIAKPYPNASKSSESKDQLSFWLACGMGIKNVHVWELNIESEDDLNDDTKSRRDKWTCIYDIATNGSSITHLGFRSGSCELISKCDKMNIRVWHLKSYYDDPSQKPAYEDVPNTHDIKCLAEYSPLIFGGVFDFAMVNVDKSVPREANRSVLELPERGDNMNNDDDPANRRRRAMREIEDIVCTQDGSHVLILCADGQVLHHYRDIFSNNCTDDTEDGGSSRQPKTSERLQELSSLQRDHDNDQLYLLRRIGKQGVVVLIRVQYCNDISSGNLPPLSRSASNTSTNSGNAGTTTNALLGVAAVPTSSGPKKLKTKISISVLSDYTRKSSSWSSLLSASNEIEESMVKVPHTHWHSSGKYFQHPSIAADSVSEPVIEQSVVQSNECSVNLSLYGELTTEKLPSTPKVLIDEIRVDHKSLSSLRNDSLIIESVIRTPQQALKKIITPNNQSSGSSNNNTPRQSSENYSNKILSTPVESISTREKMEEISMNKLTTKISPTDEANKISKAFNSCSSTPIAPSLQSTPEPNNNRPSIAIRSTISKDFEIESNSTKSVSSTSSNKRVQNTPPTKPRTNNQQPQQIEQDLMYSGIAGNQQKAENSLKRKAISALENEGPLPRNKRMKESFEVKPMVVKKLPNEALSLRNTLNNYFSSWKESIGDCIESESKCDNLQQLLTMFPPHLHTHRAVQRIEFEQRQCLQHFLEEVMHTWKMNFTDLVQTMNSVKEQRKAKHVDLSSSPISTHTQTTVETGSPIPRQCKRIEQMMSSPSSEDRYSSFGSPISAATSTAQTNSPNEKSALTDDDEDVASLSATSSPSWRWKPLDTAVLLLEKKFTEILLPRHKLELMSAISRDSIATQSLVMDNSSLSRMNIFNYDLAVSAFRVVLQKCEDFSKNISGNISDALYSS